jgi:hypothetical protein
MLRKPAKERMTRTSRDMMVKLRTSEKPGRLEGIDTQV